MIKQVNNLKHLKMILIYLYELNINQDIELINTFVKL